MRHFFVLILAMLLLLTACSEPADRDAKVGRLHRAYVDAARTNWADSGPRPLAATVWYPAGAGSVESEWRVGVFRFGRNAIDAPFADARRHPLIVLSHGTGGSAAQLSWLAENLVNAGFLVAAVNHHGNTAAEDTAWPQGFIFPAERARDLTVVIDQLLADKELAPHIDPARIGAAGFSIGGYSVLAAAGAQLSFAERQLRCANEADNPVCSLPPEAGFSEADLQALANSDTTFKTALVRDEQPVNDRRIRAVYAIAPAFVSLLERQDLSSIHVPVRFALAEEDQQILFSRTLDAVKDSMPDATAIAIPHAGHYSFLAPCNFRGTLFMSALCKDSKQVDRLDVHHRIGLDAARFFNAHLQP